MAFSSRATSSRLSTTGSLRGSDTRTSLRARSGRSSVGEEEAERRDDAVHRRHRHPGVLLFDLESAHVVRARRVGRASEKGRKARDVADVITLRRCRKAAHRHVIGQALAQRRGGNHGYRLVHRSAPQMKGARCSACARPRSIPAATCDIYPAIAKCAHPAERVRTAARIINNGVPGFLSIPLV